MDKFREQTPVKRDKTTSPELPRRKLSRPSIAELRLFLHTWGQSFSSATSARDVGLLEIEEKVIDVSMGETHLFLLTRGGQVLGFGDNSFGQISGSARRWTAPLPVEFLGQSKITKIFCGADFTFCIGNKNEVWSWGQNLRGQLGHGHCETVTTPTLVRNLRAEDDSHGRAASARTLIEDKVGSGEAVVAVACGSCHALALTSKNRVFACGQGENYALATRTTVNLTTFKEAGLVKDLIDAQSHPVIDKIVCGVSHSGFILNKKAYVWGAFASGGILAKKPTIISSNIEFEDIVLGDLSSTFLSTKKEVVVLGEFAFGSNHPSKQNLSTPHIAPERLNLPCKIGGIFGGLNHVLMVSLDGDKVFGIGSNHTAQINPFSTESYFAQPEELSWLQGIGGLKFFARGHSTFCLAREQLQSRELQLALRLHEADRLKAKYIDVRNRIERIARKNEALTAENERLRAIANKTSERGASSQGSQNSQEEISSDQVNINNSLITSHRQIQIRAQGRKNDQANLRNRFQRNRNHGKHRRRKFRQDLPRKMARDRRRRQDAEGGTHEGGKHQRFSL